MSNDTSQEYAYAIIKEGKHGVEYTFAIALDLAIAKQHIEQQARETFEEHKRDGWYEEITGDFHGVWTDEDEQDGFWLYKYTDSDSINKRGESTMDYPFKDFRIRRYPLVKAAQS